MVDSITLYHPVPIRPPTTTTTVSTMGKEKDKSRISIHLDAPYVLFRGTSGAGANDAEPGFLSGYVSLYLTESTDLRAVTLHLRGKARVPVPPSESLINAPSVQSVVVYSHDWSFLDFEHDHHQHQHTRTLKAGRHIFPFSLTLPPTLPSSLSTELQNSMTFSTSFNGTRASIIYKLRAVAARPSFSSSLSSLSSFTSHHPLIHILQHNLTTTHPVHLIRAPSPESLEYQQSVEVENTWPHKLMYAITIPHKAWAAGDTVIAVLRFSPLSKGVWVESVVTTLWETIEILAVNTIQQQQQQQNQPRKVVHQESRIIRCIKHEIVNGKAVRVDLGKPPKSALHFSQQEVSHHHHEPPSHGDTDDDDGDGEEYTNQDVITYITFPLPPMPYNSKPSTPTTVPSTPAGSRPSTRPPSPTDPTATPLASSSSNAPFPFPSPLAISRPSSPTLPFSSSSSSSSLALTPTLSPTHHLPPLHISHRLRLSILIHNRDGHTSELRCSLPVNILDGKVLFESREGGVALGARRVCVEGVLQSRRADNNAAANGSEVLIEEIESEDDLSQALGFDNPSSLPSAAGDRDLPSYHAHLRDRVAVPGLELSDVAEFGGGGAQAQTVSSPVSQVPPAPVVRVEVEEEVVEVSRHPDTTTNAQAHIPQPDRLGANLTPPPLDLVPVPIPDTNATPPTLTPISPTPSPTTYSNSPSPSPSSATSSSSTTTASSSFSSRLTRRHSHSQAVVSNKGNRDRNRSRSHSHTPPLLEGGMKRLLTREGLSAGAGAGEPASTPSVEGHTTGCISGGGGGGGSGHVHVRTLSSFFRATVIKPFTSLGGTSSSTSSSSTSPLSSPPRPVASNVNNGEGESCNLMMMMTSTISNSTPSVPNSPNQNQNGNGNGNGSLSQVPTYTTASLATYLGGVQPLSSLVGLPSYEDVVNG